MDPATSRSVRPLLDSDLLWLKQSLEVMARHYFTISFLFCFVLRPCTEPLQFSVLLNKYLTGYDWPFWI